MPRILDTTVRTVATVLYVYHILYTYIHVHYICVHVRTVQKLYMYHVQQYSTHVHVPCMYT
jgi:hypothetical protein